MYCKYCGSEIDDDSLVCCHCGKHLYQTPPSHKTDKAYNTADRYPRESARQYGNRNTHRSQDGKNSEHRPRYLSEEPPKRNVGRVIFKVFSSLLSIGLILWAISYFGLYENRPLGYYDMKEAYNASKEIIAEDLMSPQSADFPRFSTDFVLQRYEEVMHEGEEYHVYPVRAYVDAENMFGTVSRSYYIVEVGLPQNPDIDGYIYNVVYEDIEVPPELHEYKEVLGLTNAEEVALPAEENPIAEPEQTAVPEENSHKKESEYYNPTNFPTPEEELAAVIHGRGLINLNGGLLNLYEITKLSEHMDGTEILHPIDFCIADLDQDGKIEIVVTMARGYGDPWRLVLRYQEGNIYGYGFPYRGMKRISIDGRCEVSFSADDTHILRLSFDAAEVKTEEFSVDESESIWGEWIEVDWHEFTEENINQYIGDKQ